MKFNDNFFDIEGVPMTNANTITIHDALNDKHSVYGDEAFSAKPSGSSYLSVFKWFETGGLVS
jgi:hypothetical protein